MIKNSKDFENSFLQQFGEIDRDTLGALKSKIRFDLGGEGKISVRNRQALFRSRHILDYCFGDSYIWLRIILWNENEELNLEKAGLTLDDADPFFKDADILYLFFQKYAYNFVEPVVVSNINYEVAKDPSANITCYFVNFQKSLIVNIYDDRGMDVYCSNKYFLNELSEKFHSWLNVNSFYEK